MVGSTKRKSVLKLCRLGVEEDRSNTTSRDGGMLKMIYCVNRRRGDLMGGETDRWLKYSKLLSST